MRRFFLIFLFLACLYLSFTAGGVLAANSIPDEFVPCDEESTENPEFNSLRPYQASPCGDSIKAAYCNNNYKIEEKVSTSWSPKCNIVDGVYVCPYSKLIERNYEISLADVKLPIAGNTQETANSVNGTSETIDDAQKMNEYLNWYLSGTNQKAEYGEDPEDKTVNFSGPVKKLTPKSIQEFQRFSVLHDAGAKEIFTIEANGSVDAQDVKETSNHNQIAVCTTKNVFGIDNPWIGEEKPTPCYGGGGDESEGKAYRLVDWWEGKQADYLESFKPIEGWDGHTPWRYTTPPFPWQFKEDIYYQKAYMEWEGKECIIESTPLLGLLNKLTGKKLLCVDLKLPGVIDVHSNRWADFYQYIPLGDSPDKSARHVIPGLQVDAQGKTEASLAEGTGYVLEKEPLLYYPHTRAVYDLLTLLNKTHSTGGADTGERAPVSGNDYDPATCEVVDVRANSGDDLTFDNRSDLHKVYIRDVKIEVNQIECDGEVRQWFDECGDIPGLNPLPKCQRYPTCSANITVTIPSTPKIPYAENIYEEAVIGASAFRKIFPKIEVGAPVSCIADIPAVSDVTYVASSDTNLVAVDTPEGKKSPEEAKLFFPHFGSAYEYFLKGIQTALRPQGYGEPITQGTQCINVAACGDWEKEIKKVRSGGACGICNTEIGDLANKILTAAGTAYNVPAANIWAAMLHEGGDWKGFKGFKDEDVRKWSTSKLCGGEDMPKCNNDEEATQPPFGFLKNWFYGEGDNATWRAVMVIDPTRNSPEKVSRCNFLDAAFAAAKTLSQGASNTTAATSCGPYSFDNKSVGSCSSWSDAKIAQSQTTYAGYCVNGSEGQLYSIEEAVGWYHAASCQ